MDTNPESARFLELSSVHPSPLQPSPTNTAPDFHRYSSGSDSGSSSDSGGANHTQRLQGVQQPFDPQLLQFVAQNQPFPPTARFANGPATIYVDDPPYIPPEISQTVQPTQFAHNASHVQFPTVFGAYDVHMPPPMTSSPPQHQQAGQGLESGRSSPSSIRSGRSDRSHHSAHQSQESVSSGVSDHDQHYLVQNASVEPPSHVQHPSVHANFPYGSRDHYPAYDSHSNRIGFELAMKSTPHSGDGQSHYRTRTFAYSSADQDAHIMTLSLDQPNAGMLPYPRQNTAPVPLPPATPQMDYGHRPLSLEGRHSHGMPVGGHGHGFPQPPAPQPGSTMHDIYTPDLPDPTPNLRQLLGLGPDEEVSLRSLADPPPGEKPNYPYPTLIKLAIHGSPRKRLTLQEIYIALENRFQWFRDNAHDKAWQNSIRHNLSLNKCFRRIAKPITEPGKGSYWIVDYSQGEGNKRARKRNKRPTKAELARRAKEASTSQQQQQQDETSSSDDDDSAGTPPQSRGQSQVQSQPQMQSQPAISQSQAPNLDDSNIDPELRTMGHVVGDGRMRATGSTHRRPSPYTPSASSSTSRGSSQSRGPVPATAAMTAVQVVPQQLSVGAFGQFTSGQQSTFGQTSFPDWSGAFPGGQGQSVSRFQHQQSTYGSDASQQFTLGMPTMNPTLGSSMGAGPSSGRHTRSMTQAAGFNPRNAPFHVPAPREGITHVRDGNGLVTARRVPTTSGSGTQTAPASLGGSSGTRTPGSRRSSGSSSSSLSQA